MRFVVGLLVASVMVFCTSLQASAQGVGGGGGSTGGGGGTGGGGWGGGGGGGASCGFSSVCCGTGQVMLLWNELTYGGASFLKGAYTNAQLNAIIPANLYGPSNLKGDIYTAGNTPWGGGVMPNNRDQNGANYWPWWGCAQQGSVNTVTPPTFVGFSAYAATVSNNGALTIDKPTCGAQVCKDFLVFDTVQVSATACGAPTPFGVLTPMVVPAGYPVSNTGTAYYSNQPNCPQSVTIAGTDTTNTFQYKYTLEWKEVVVCGGAYYRWNWGDGSPDTCAGRVVSHQYTHVFPKGPATATNGAKISGTQNWQPVCSALVLEIATGAYPVNDPNPGSYPCTGAAVLAQPLGPTPPHAILQIETLSQG